MGPLVYTAAAHNPCGLCRNKNLMLGSDQQAAASETFGVGRGRLALRNLPYSIRSAVHGNRSADVAEEALTAVIRAACATRPTSTHRGHYYRFRFSGPVVLARRKQAARKSSGLVTATPLLPTDPVAGAFTGCTWLATGPIPHSRKFTALLPARN